jgi:hypothetical protein
MKFPGVPETVGTKPPDFCAAAGVDVEAVGVNPPAFGAEDVVVAANEEVDLDPVKVELEVLVCEVPDSFGFSSAAANNCEVLLEFSGSFG